MNNNKTESSFNLVKMSLGWFLTFLLRLIPFRPPNIEPILAIQMPLTKHFGFLAGFIFAFFNILLFDLITGRTGLWTLITATTYGFLALFSRWYFKKRKSTSLNYAIHAVLATLIYDAITGLSIGPLFFNQSFMVALSGQIMFTIYHLIGNVFLALFFSSVVYRFLAINPKLNFNYLKQKIMTSV